LFEDGFNLMHPEVYVTYSSVAHSRVKSSRGKKLIRVFFISRKRSRMTPRPSFEWMKGGNFGFNIGWWFQRIES